MAGGHGRPGADAGATLRAIRTSRGMTLAELGRRCGYSASQVSRFERAVCPLTDVTVIRRLTAALDVDPRVFGLAPVSDGPPRHAANDSRRNPAGPIVIRDPRREDGDDPVRRRELLAGAAGLASAAALGVPVGEHPPGAGAAPPAGWPEALLYWPAAAPPAPVGALRRAVATARADFQQARYDRLAAGLPGLIATAAATSDAAGARHAAASALLAEAYITATNLMVKLNDDPLALALADRALRAALAGDDPLTAADAQRAVATVLRRCGHRARARELLRSALRQAEPAAAASPARLSVYGTLAAVAAYTAAVDGDRSAAADLIAEARAAALRLGGDANHRFTAFGPTNVALYQVSIAQVLGEPGLAIRHARTLRVAAIPTPERRGRFWIDVARAWHQWGRPEECYRALLAAERAAPAEVRYRPPVHRITEDLLRSARHPMPGLREFARRIGLPSPR